jgi:hypothetical protein
MPLTKRELGDLDPTAWMLRFEALDHLKHFRADRGGIADTEPQHSLKAHRTRGSRELFPLLLGSGIRLFENLAKTPIELGGPTVSEGNFVSHLAYQVR